MSSGLAADGRKLHLDGVAIVLIVVCCMIWGFQQIAIKAIAHEISYVMQATLRSIGSSICIWLWMRYKGIPVFAKDKTLIPGMIAGFLFALEFLLLYSGLEFTNTSRAIIFLYLSPFVVAGTLSIFIKSERLNTVQFLGLVIAFLALAFMFQEGLTKFQGTYLKGDVLVVLAAIAWGLTTVVVRVSTLSSIVPERTIFYQLFFSAIFLGIYCLFAEIPLPKTLSSLALASMALQIVVVAAASYLVWFWLLRHYLATKVASFGFLTPIFGFIFSVLLMGDPLSSRLVIGLIGVAVGIFLVNKKRS